MNQLFTILLGLQRGTPKHGDWVLICLEGAWNKLLGDRLAAVCRPIRLNDSELVVEILDREWEEAIEGVRSDLLEKLRNATGEEVKTLKFSRQSPVVSRQ